MCLSITAGEKKVADESAESMVSALMDGFDTSQDGKISLQELMDHIGDNAEVHAAYEGWQTGFSQADADQDGHLTAEELAFLLQSATEQQKDQLVQESEESIAALLVDGFDADKDGSISLKELFDHVGDDTTVRKSFQGWQSGFTEADVDSDGRLSVKELASLLKHVSFQGQSKLIDESEMSIAASIMDGFDTNRDRMISLQELEGHVGDREQIHAAFAGWQEGFSQADVNKDGHLTEKELASLISHVSRQDQHKMVEHSEETIAEQVMAGLDTNRDQKISLEELKHHMGEGAEMHAAFAGWDEGFLQADADQDAELDMHELTSLLSQVSRLDQRKLVVDSEVETADSIMDGFDTDKDGKLGLQELLDHVGDIGDIHAAFAGWQEGFKQADFDKDGYLGHDELASLMGRVSNQDQKKLVHASEASVAISLMNGFDMDGDGKISLQELLAHVGDDEHLHAAFSGWKLGFREADADRDGHLSAEELTSLLGHVSRENQHHMVHKNDESIAHKIMDGFDSNKDGKLSYEELQEHLHNNKKMTATFQGLLGIGTDRKSVV